MPPRSSSHSISEGKFALVRWRDGKYKGSLTHNVSVEWILNYDPTSLCPETYAVEWRQPPRPRSGWPVLNADVLDVSADVDYLRNKMMVLKRQEEGACFESPIRSTDHRSRSLATQDQSQSQSRSLITEDQPRSLDLDAIQALLRRLQEGSSGTTTEQPSATKEMVSVGKSLKVEKHIWTLAKNACSPGRMVRPLLRQAFSRRRLVSSSYAGQKRTVQGVTVVKKGLKKYQKMADIHAAVLGKFPHLSQAYFGSLVNSFLGPQANVVHHMEYIEQSESDQDSGDE